MIYLFIDTETTGLGKSDVVLQLAYIATNADGSEVLEKDATFAHEFDYEIHPEAAKVNGLTKEIVKAKGYWPPSIERTLQMLHTLAESMFVVGHNIDFDLRLIRQTCERYGVEFPATVNTICTKKAAQKAKIPAKLGDLHNHLFGKDFDGAHDALADVKATARCFFELKRLGLL
jgi:DNA polymerase III epsilon subunit-like protein